MNPEAGDRAPTTRRVYCQGSMHQYLEVVAEDERGEAGANHFYRINWEAPNQASAQPLRFQQGPVGEAGVNGVTNEALLAIVIDRLQGFQTGQFACRENALALTKCEEALLWLEKRTAERMQRGVEGTNHP